MSLLCFHSNIITGDKVPTSMLAAGALGSIDKDDDKKGDAGGAGDLLGAAAGLLGKK